MGLGCYEQFEKERVEAISGTRLVIWNGPAGLFGFKDFAGGAGSLMGAVVRTGIMRSNQEGGATKNEDLLNNFKVQEY